MGAPELTLTVDADRIQISPRSVMTAIDSVDPDYMSPDSPFSIIRSAVIAVDGVPVPHAGQVRRLTEPCQTCGGAMFTLGWRPSGCNWAEVEEPCSDCLKGRQTFTLHQRCEHEKAEQLDGTNDWTCPVCHSKGRDINEWDNGVIDLGDGWVITQVLPISKPYGLAYTGKPYISINDEGAAIIGQRESVGPVPITLPPAARPDMLAVFAERETR